MSEVRSGIGDRPKRREDLRFLTGHGAYLDDLAFDGLTHAVVLRSPHAHARIAGIDTSTALAAPGVLAVLTADDAQDDGLQPLLPTATANAQTGEPFAFAPQPVLAAVKARYAGEPVAVIVAETRAQALDAAELVAVEYVSLPAVTTVEAAGAADAPQVADEAPGNLCFDWRTGDSEAVDTAFAAAAHVVRLKLDNHRIVTNPMEPRGLVGLWDAERLRYTAYVSAQSIHNTRDHAARALGVAPAAVRFVAPDVGGGFGAKNFIYPEHVLIPWAAKRVGRPVKWIASRSEVFLADHQARDQVAEAALALDMRGRFLALRIESTANAGAYLVSAGGVQTFQYVHLPGTVYRIPAIALRVAAVLTNTAPIGVTRGPGFAEMVNIIERLIDKAARQCGFDRAELRRLNLVPAAAMPMTNPLGSKVDSGAFPETFERALARADVAGFAARRRDSEARGLLRGLGFAYHIKATGGSPSENVDIRFEADGTVALITGTQTIGQGHETTFPQILADRLGVPNERVRLVQGDTDLIPLGGGHGSSRATYMGGTAIWRAADEIIAKGTRAAAEALEAAEADIRFEDGDFVVAGTDRRVGPLRGRRDGARQRLAARHLLRLDAGVDDIPQRRPCRRGRDRPRHRPGNARALHRDRRLRRLGQPDDRLGSGAWRDRARRRPGVDRTRGLRPPWPARRRLVDGLRAAARRRPAALRTRLQQHPLHDQPARRQGLRGSGCGRRLPGGRQRDPRRARPVRRRRPRRPRHSGAGLATYRGAQSLIDGLSRNSRGTGK